MSVEGIDYAFSVPSVPAIVAAGKKFVVRYGGPGSLSKQLKAAELAALKAAGIWIVANAEGTANGFQGTTAGIAWAKQAKLYFDTLGMPADRPIYFSVDWNPTSADWPKIDAALKGAASVIGANRVGVYGGYSTIAHCVNAKTAKWFWQTYAWSGGKWHPACHIQQYHNGIKVGTATVDADRAMVADYGQWGVTMPAPKMLPIQGVVPELHHGMHDPVVPNDGTVWIRRLQAELNRITPVKIDGWYGDATAVAVQKMMTAVNGRTTQDGTIVAMPEWRVLTGIW